MADAHEIFQVTAPAGTLPAAPLEVATRFDPAIVLAVEVRWPSGHASTTGIRIAVAHQAVLPRTPGGWILGDGMVRTYPVTRMPDSGQWSVFVYNTDNRPHYWQVTYEVEDVPIRREHLIGSVQRINPHAIHVAAGTRRFGT